MPRVGALAFVLCFTTSQHVVYYEVSDAATQAASARQVEPKVNAQVAEYFGEAPAKTVSSGMRARTR